ncbi:hypothetical protein G4B88_015873 [Cannabis sativa]|uniref:Ubiquitin-like protease family profile domain-containing protein n=1 Tax=Cannabis sativa TaxID=3483 RepID=A0A7J6DWC8_CANSA|nr:hypothetical protein G4B88_015873 [Cannabis sativa]
MHTHTHIEFQHTYSCKEETLALMPKEVLPSLFQGIKNLFSPQYQPNRSCDKALSSDYEVVFQKRSLQGLYTNVLDTSSYHSLLSINYSNESMTQLGKEEPKLTDTHKSLERSLSLIVLASFFPLGGLGSLTSLPILRAWQNPHIQSSSGTSFNGGFRHFKWNPPKQSSHSIITALPDLKHTLHSSTTGSSSSELASSLLLTYTSSPTSNSPPSYTTFLVQGFFHIWGFGNYNVSIPLPSNGIFRIIKGLPNCLSIGGSLPISQISWKSKLREVRRVERRRPGVEVAGVEGVSVDLELKQGELVDLLGEWRAVVLGALAMDLGIDQRRSCLGLEQTWQVVIAVPAADVNPSEAVRGSDKNVKDVEKPKGDESRLKGDDFFDGLSQLEIDDDQVVLAGLEAVGKIHVPAPNPDVVCQKSDALHTDEETEDTVSDTPLLDKRKRAPALKSPFVDFGSADVESTPMELMSSGSQSAGDDRDFKMVTYVKGLYALNDAFADPVSTEIEAKFDAWIGEGLLKHPRHYNCYEDGAKKFTAGFRLGVDYVEDKTWFYHLATCDMFMNDSHMNTIFYYLRKKGKYSFAVTLNFATTDCLFDDSIQALYHKYNKAKSMKTKMSHIHAAHPIAHYIRGMRIPCSKPWYEADHVLFIINLRRESHWVFGRLDLNEGMLFLYNSLRTAKMNVAARNAMKAYFVLLPLFFDLLGFWKNRAQAPASGSDPTAPLRIVELSGLPSQQKNDCGAYVAAFAEFFIHGKDVPADFDIEVYPTSSGTTTTTTTITTDANLIDGRGWGSTGAATTPSRYKNQKRRRLPAPARSARPGTASMPSSVASAQPTKSTVVDRKLTRSVHTPSDFTCVRLGIFRPKPASSRGKFPWADRVGDVGPYSCGFLLLLFD